MLLSWHGLRQSHRYHHAHNVEWICTYGSRLECVPTPQGQEHPWLRKGCSPNYEIPSYKVHDHPQTGIYIYTHTHTYIMHNGSMQSGESKANIAKIIIRRFTMIGEGFVIEMVDN